MSSKSQRARDLRAARPLLSVHAIARACNMDRRDVRRALRRKSRTKLDAGKVLELRALAGTLTRRQMAQRYGVSATYAAQVARGLYWKQTG